MKKKTTSRLSLNREIITPLSKKEINTVLGGAGATNSKQDTKTPPPPPPPPPGATTLQSYISQDCASFGKP